MGMLDWRITRDLVYEKILSLLRNKKTAGGLVLQENFDQYPYILKSSVGVLCVEDSEKDAKGITYPVLLEVFDFLPEKYEERCAFKQKISDMKQSITRWLKNRQAVLTLKESEKQMSS